ncbi:MAG: peptidoglycan DD-metalloendopeptidase family protein [Bdellovibrio sp.]|nr:peptidoglycan DD-metalloendopeptidase family protein [Methylotenera sp.]
MRVLVVSCLLLFLTACESNPPAPVIDRTPQTSKPKPPVAVKPIDPKLVSAKDWRPDSHAVAKGETLFGIGLQYGIDYKEIAAANHIASPYPIRIGQKLDLSSFKTKTITPSDSTKTDTTKTDDGVIVTSIKVEPVTTGTATKPNTVPMNGSAVTPVLTEPKATLEPYSVAAWNRVSSAKVITKSAETKPAENKPSVANTADGQSADGKSTYVKPADDESISWGWPTQGKISAGFVEASNKGIDIAGTTGQAINAAAPGKVIYSGSDLRGYGKLVIIKHNKTYLSVYAHNSKIVVKEGQAVAAGQKIAEMGNTDANSVKLHFEIRRLGKSVDPAKYLTQN